MVMALAKARKLWRDAPADDDVLVMYLSAAQDAVNAYQYDQGYVSAETFDLAITMQARNIWNSGKASPSPDGDGVYALSTSPLDWQVKQLLRPQRGIGAIV